MVLPLSLRARSLEVGPTIFKKLYLISLGEIKSVVGLNRKDGMPSLTFVIENLKLGSKYRLKIYEVKVSATLITQNQLTIAELKTLAVLK